MFAIVCFAPHQRKLPCKDTKKINRRKAPTPIISVKFHEIVYVLPTRARQNAGRGLPVVPRQVAIILLAT